MIVCNTSVEGLDRGSCTTCDPKRATVHGILKQLTARRQIKPAQKQIVYGVAGTVQIHNTAVHIADNRIVGQVHGPRV